MANNVMLCRAPIAGLTGEVNITIFEKLYVVRMMDRRYICIR